MIKIELSDLPEFERDLKITITLQKDINGVVGEDVKVLSDSSVNPVGNISTLGNNNEENSKNNTLSSSTSPKSSETKDSSLVSKKTPKKKKVSGNLMDLDF